MPPKEIPLNVFIGKRYGSWIVLGQAGPYICPGGSNKGRRVKAKCDCGIVKDVILSTLKLGTSTNCGCIRKEIQRKAVTTHGLTKHPLYRILVDIKSRCYSKNDTTYEYYGGRGITVCNEWKNNVKAFAEWALNNGWKKGLNIDRIDNDGNYEPDNCRFLTVADSNRHTRLLWKTNTSGYRGVSFNKAYKKYVAYIDVNKQQKQLGTFSSAIEAALAYDREARIANDYRPLNFEYGNS